MSGFFNSPGCFTYLTETPGITSNALKSVKLEILGTRMTAISINPTSWFPENRSVKLSSSSTSNSMYGATPTTGIPVFSSRATTPGSSMVLSPRNLLMIIPFTISCSSFSRSIMVPINWAKTPPLSMSPTSRTGALACFAIPIFTISSCLRLISAGLPAPSMTMISYSSSSL